MSTATLLIVIVVLFCCLAAAFTAAGVGIKSIQLKLRRAPASVGAL